MRSNRPLYWWAGIASVLPRTSTIPATGNRWIDRWNELRWALARPPVFPWPDISKAVARALAKPTCTGFGDLLCAWMMPMTVADLMGWRLRIPVPRVAGGIHHDSRRPPLTAEWFHAKLDLPPHVELVPADRAPDDCEWFCTVEPQWYLNSCTETSFDTIPSWLRSDGIERSRYYARYRALAGTLVRADRNAYFRGDIPFLALHARRGDRGEATEDERRLHQILRVLGRQCRHWVVISDDATTKVRLAASLRELGCLTITETDVAHADDLNEKVLADFRAMVAAAGVVCSVKGGWSSFPYAATRVSGAPLLFTTELKDARIWRLFHAYSTIPIRGTHLGLAGARDFCAAVAGSGALH